MDLHASQIRPGEVVVPLWCELSPRGVASVARHYRESIGGAPTMGTRRQALPPVDLTIFIGKRSELAGVGRMLQSSRLVTLTRIDRPLRRRSLPVVAGRRFELPVSAARSQFVMTPDVTRAAAERSVLRRSRVA